MSRRCRRFVTSAIFVACATLGTLAWARPGGGHSYGGGGGGGGGGSGGGGGGGDLGLLFALVFEVPELGVPLLIIVVIVLIWRAQMNAREADWAASVETNIEPARRPAHRHGSPRAQLEQLREDDPDFSVIVFEDFVQALWSELLVARGRGALDVMKPWVGEAAAQNLPFLGKVDEVTSPIVGSIAYREVNFDGQRVVARLTIEGMYSTRRGGQVESFWVREHLRLLRNRGAKSRPPERVAIFNCPNCGAPPENAQKGRCKYCDRVVNDGTFDWVIAAIERVASESRPPQLTSTVDESGTERPTVFAPDVRAQLEGFLRRGFDEAAFGHRLATAFAELQAGWSALDLARIRPWVTDRQLDSMRFWLESYRAAGLRNVSENRVIKTEIVRITHDLWYSAVTVRVFATGHDYTLDAAGTVVAGSRSRSRPFSEYWTMIRSAKAPGTKRGPSECPNCGAPLAIDMAGACTHCHAHVVSGEFDWVLSRIEQDEAYSG